jgi:uncharacterized protein
MGGRRADRQRPFLRRAKDREHQLCPAGQQELYRALPRAHAYGKYIARLANLLSGGIIVQRLGDLRAGRRTTDQRLERCITRPTLQEATPGDLNLVLPYRYVVNILEMLDALDQVAPGVASRHTLLYGVEAKFYSSRLRLTP